MPLTIDDYSTETGLRVRITSHTTGTTVQLPVEEWEQLVVDIKAGRYDDIANTPKIPFVHWPEK